MSEHISNRTRQREALKQIIRQLHEGRDPEELKAQFADVLKQAGASEIGALESELIAEGLPESEVKRLCDVHVAVFEEALLEQPKPETVPGHPVHTFRAENEALVGLLPEAKAAAGKVGQATTLEVARQAFAELQPLLLQLKQVEKHYIREENLLFPYLEKRGIKGPSTVMWALHDDVRAGFRRLVALAEQVGSYDLAGLKAAVAGTLNPTLQEMAGLFYKEDNILFPMSLENLTGEEWQAIQDQSDEIGYALVQPTVKWSAPAAAAPELPANAPLAPAGSLVPLSVGALSPAQIDAMLKNLPVDVTFVDQDDRVRYFSQGKERIFVRTEAIIGRLVQNCHPPASVDRVKRILDDFKAGRRDSAEFWIQMHGRFVHIRYFALRDAEGQYMGTLEVTQDATHIRELSGERRLMAE